MKTVLHLLPPKIRQALIKLPQDKQKISEELRLRVGQFFSVVLPTGEVVPDASFVITQNDLNQVIENAAKGSVHTVADKLKNGFLTVEGGHRIGLCGYGIIKNGEVESISAISSITIRIARQITNISSDILKSIIKNNCVMNTLILSPPGLGKTTLLRDIICNLSDNFRVAVADERGEIAGCWQGIPQMNIGCHTDVMDGIPKAKAAMMLVRSMNPQVIAIDEITAPEDVAAIENCFGCGVSIIATAHGSDVSDLKKRPVYQLLDNVFERIITISRTGLDRTYQVGDVKKC